MSVIVPLGHELLELLEGGGGALPFKPPMAMTGLPVASWTRPAAARADAFLGASWKRWIMRLDVDTA